MSQLPLFSTEPALPYGFRYRPDLLFAEEERLLVEHLRELPFQEFQFQGYVGKRRVVSYGWRYDFNQRELQPAEPLPPFLLSVRAAAAGWAEIDPARLEHVLITEYAPGAGIGWHRDRGEFGGGDRGLAPLPLPLPPPTQDRSHLGARFAPAGAPLRLPAARTGAHRVGAQHPRSGGAAILAHVPHT